MEPSHLASDQRNDFVVGIDPDEVDEIFHSSTNNPEAGVLGGLLPGNVKKNEGTFAAPSFQVNKPHQIFSTTTTRTVIYTCVEETIDLNCAADLNCYVAKPTLSESPSAVLNYIQDCAPPCALRDTVAPKKDVRFLFSFVQAFCICVGLVLENIRSLDTSRNIHSDFIDYQGLLASTTSSTITSTTTTSFCDPHTYSPVIILSCHGAEGYLIFQRDGQEHRVYEDELQIWVAAMIENLTMPELVVMLCCESSSWVPSVFQGLTNVICLQGSVSAEIAFNFCIQLLGRLFESAKLGEAFEDAVRCTSWYYEFLPGEAPFAIVYRSCEDQNKVIFSPTTTTATATVTATVTATSTITSSTSTTSTRSTALTSHDVFRTFVQNTSLACVYKRALSRRKKLFIVYGERGVGKSWLVRDLVSSNDFGMAVYMEGFDSSMETHEVLALLERKSGTTGDLVIIIKVKRVSLEIRNAVLECRDGIYVIVEADCVSEEVKSNAITTSSDSESSNTDTDTLCHSRTSSLRAANKVVLHPVKPWSVERISFLVYKNLGKVVGGGMSELQMLEKSTFIRYLRGNPKATMVWVEALRARGVRHARNVLVSEADSSYKKVMEDESAFPVDTRGTSDLITYIDF